MVALICLVCTTVPTNAQQIEFGINLNSGPHYFGGSDAQENTGIVLDRIYLYTSYGKKRSFSYEFSIEGQRITAKKLIYGISLAYQSLQSKSNITVISPSIISSAIWLATGSSKQTSRFIGMAPFAGYRIKEGKIAFDIKAGLQLAHCVDRDEKNEATYTHNGQKVYQEYDASQSPSSLRLRLELTSSYKFIGLTGGCLWGVKNFASKDNGNPKAFSRYFWIGMSYRIKKWTSPGTNRTQSQSRITNFLNYTAAG